MTPRSFLMALWRNLFKEQKVYGDLKTLYDLRKKGEHWAWVSLDGIHISKKKVFLSKAYCLSLKLGKYLAKLKLKAKEPRWILLKFMVNLYGVLVLVCVILIFVLLLLLYLTASLAGMFLQGLNLGLQMFLQSKVRKGLSLGKTRRY